METRYCPECSKANAASSRFCQHCGATLTQTLPSTQVQQAAAAPAPPQPAPMYPLQPQPARLPQAIGQMGTGGLSAANIWGPFAGYGERGRHVSWLLDNLGDRAEALREAVANRFQERQIPDARVQAQTLTGRGIAVERRPYHLIQRGVATAGLYIARFGQDLYISQVTYAKGAINFVRLAILSLMVLFQLYAMVSAATAVAAMSSFNLLGGSSRDLGSPVFSTCCIGPLSAVNSLALTLAVLHMVYKFITEKDPLALLRTPPNEFQQDDIVALEKAVEETVRQSLDTIGVDKALMPPAREYGIKRRLI
jgi:hypothetical protein